MEQQNLRYLAEGAANIVYTITTRPKFKGVSVDRPQYVLRLRKDLPHTTAVTKMVEDFNQHIKPLFDPSLLLHHELYPLKPELVATLNADLHAREDHSHPSPRPLKRRGVYLPPYAEEQWGIMMPNLASASTSLIEIKPKWLVQSPSAPENAQCCRTCALRDIRKATGVVQGRGSAGFCPFDLLSKNPSVAKQVLASIWPFDISQIDDFAIAFNQYVRPVLHHLQNEQKRYNSVGLSDFESGHVDLPIAMALRDCSLFMQVSTNSGTVEIQDVKLADLDLKAPNRGKIQQWAAVERELINGGYYLGTSSGLQDGLLCALGLKEARARDFQEGRE